MRILLTIILALLVVGCNGNMSTSVMTSQNTDLSVRAGGFVEPNTEVGAVVKYATSDELDWGFSPDIYGGYVLFHLTQEVSIEDTPEPSILQPFLESLKARPYAGLELTGDKRANYRVQPNWILGTSFGLSEESNVTLNVEYITGDTSPDDVFIGIQARF